MNLDNKTYNKTSVCHFSKAQEQWGEFGNMTGKFPFRITRNELIPSTENLYQAMRFTDYPKIQKEIISEPSGFGAKNLNSPSNQTYPSKSVFPNLVAANNGAVAGAQPW